MRGDLQRAMAALRRRHRATPLPAGITPEMLAIAPAGRPRTWTAWQAGGDLLLRPAGHPGAGSLLATLQVAEQVVVSGGLEPAFELDLDQALPGLPSTPAAGMVTIASDLEAVTLDLFQRPRWASAAGRDEYGLWAAFEVDGVVQRLRWIPPGRFLMGSPEDEAGRWRDEGPRHQVIISEGFWLADTPCTQELWQAVMGDNPSYFRSPRRPVEQVSWDRCQELLAQLEERVPGLDARLPTEAQWEYACRAGTRAATWVGDLEILGKRNAPLLDAIAWYGGNSGERFELESGWDTSGWPEMQYRNPRAGIREVATRRANPWGLYDMLGNVWEWCADWFERYSPEAVVDPADPVRGSDRVFRGGSWFNHARNVRAASRDWDEPGFRVSYLGFRLARGQ